MATAVRPAKQKKSRKHEQIKTPVIQYQSKDDSVSLSSNHQQTDTKGEIENAVDTILPNGTIDPEEIRTQNLDNVATENPEEIRTEEAEEIRTEEPLRVTPNRDFHFPDTKDLSEPRDAELAPTQYPDLTSTLAETAPTAPLVAVPAMREVKPIYPSVVSLQNPVARTVTPDLLTPEMPAKFAHADMERGVREEGRIPYEDSLAAILRPFTEMELYSFCPTPLLDSNQVYVDSFVRRARPSDLSEHPLYSLLVRLQTSRLEFLSALQDCERMERDTRDTFPLVWELTIQTVKSTGQCRDHNRVTRTHEYESAEMNMEQLQTLEAMSADLREHLLREVSLKGAHSEYERLEIVSYLSHLLGSCEEYRTLSSEHPVRAADPSLLNFITETQNACIRDCLSVLFIFERRLRTDDTFHQLVRGWISSLLSHLLRTASYSDHLFTLNHLLRCPPGVGSWGGAYIQFQPLLELSRQTKEGQTMPYNQGYGLNPLSDHFLTMLATLLLPVKERETFLKQLEIEANTPALGSGADPWVFVAEDAEDDEEAVNKKYLVEEDLISVFDQFPFTALFQYLLLDGTQGYTVERVSSHGMLTLVAFCSRLVELLGAGFSTFKLARYREFVKRLGRTVRYVVHLVSDHWLAYREHRMAAGGAHLEGDPFTHVPGHRVHSLQRIQVEMDNFVIRATKWILSSHKLGAWQFLADMPFETVSLEAVWKLFWLIHSNHLPITAEELISRGLGRVSGLKDILKDPDYREQFIDNVMRIPLSEAIFLFTTFANMARARDYSRHKDYEFIETVVLELMEVGFLNPVSRETYSRTGRDLLDTIVLKHPQVVSILVQVTSEALFMMGDGALFLFNSLPFSSWMPTPSDVQVLTSWLIRTELGSNETSLAELVLGRMNWGRREDGTLLLPASLHREVALAAVEACGRQVPKMPGNLGQEGAGQGKGLKDVLQSYLSILSDDQQKLLSWSWKVVLLLSLHSSEVKPLEIEDSEEEAYPRYPEVEGWSPHVFPLDLQHDASLVNLSHAVKTGGALACYVALNVSMVGHETDLFCHDGVDLLQVLMDNRQYIPAMRVLKNVSPRFFEQKPDAAPPNLLKVIFLLTQADISTASLTERWISGEGSKFNRCFCSLLQQQISERWSKDKQAGVKAFKFWLMTMITYPDWYRDKKLLSIINALCELAFNKPEMERALVCDLFLCVQSLPRYSKKGSRIHSVMSMVIGEQGPPSLLDCFSPQEHGWFAYYAMQAEERFEQETGIWKSLLSSLRKDTKQSFDSAIKTCASDLKVQNYPLWHLALYRWGKLSNELPKSHPVLPLCWQKFMFYFLQRPAPSGTSAQPSLGYLFFESYAYFSQHKAMRRTLVATHQHFKELGETHGEGVSEKDREMAVSLRQYFQTLELWIDEPRLHEADLYLPALPPQYNQKRLAELVSNQFSPWTDLINLTALELTIRGSCHEWTSCFEVKKPSSPVKKAEVKSVERRILDRISLSDTMSPAPPLVPIEVPFVPVLRSCLSDPLLLLTEVKKDIRCITLFYESWLHKMKDLSQMHNTLVSLTPDLYRNVSETAIVFGTCKSSCTGACQIQFRFNEARKNDSISQLIDTNLNNTETLISEVKSQVPVDFSYACLRISRTIADLKEVCENSSENRDQLFQSGRAMFYEVLSSITQKLKDFPASREFYYNSCQYLGATFIALQPGEAVVLLDQIFDRIFISDFLVSLFRPDLATSLDFLDMYAKINRLVSQHDSTIGATLLSKFDLRVWLGRQARGSQDLHKLIRYIFEGLKLKQTKQDDALLLLYISHFEDILKHDFPAVFSTVLHLLLSGGEAGDLPTHPWKSFLDRLNARRTDTDQIPGEDLLTELAFISTHLMEQRIVTQQTLYTLWQLYQQYLGAIITSLVEMAIDKRADQGDGVAGEGDLREMWDLVCDAYRPWVFPAQNPDGSVNIPWHLSESENSSMLVIKFVNSIVHIQQKLPARKGQPNILNLFWDTYSSQLAIPTTPESILERLHRGFLSLHWDLFLPSLSDLESMLQLRSSKHTLVFEAGVFVKTKWDSLLLSSQLYPTLAERSRALTCFLSLCSTFISDEYVLKQTEHAASLFSLCDNSAQQFHWDELPASEFQSLLTWLGENRPPEQFLLSSPPTSSLAKLLQAAGGFPQFSQDTDILSKQNLYVRFMVDNLSKYSLLPDAKDLLTKRAIAALISLISSVCTSTMSWEYRSTMDEGVDPSTHVTQLISELLNVLNNSAPSSAVLKTSLDSLLNSFSPSDKGTGTFPGSSSQLLCISALTASCRSLAAMPHMVQVIETCIATHFSGIYPPAQEDVTGTDGVMLLPKESGYGWKIVCDSLTIPEMSEQEFVAASLELDCYLTLFTRILLDLPNCRSLEDELTCARTLSKWCASIKPSTPVEGKLILLIVQFFKLLMRQVRFGTAPSQLLAPISNFDSILAKFTEDKSSEGILGAIGLGKKSDLSVKFRLACRILQCFVHLQQPVDCNSVIHLRIVPRAPGHPKDPSAQNRDVPGAVFPTKQAEQYLSSLSTLGSNKVYGPLFTSALPAIDIVNDIGYCFVDSPLVFMKVVSVFYPDARYLDIARVFN